MIKEENNIKLPINIKEILDLLPHRYPFILVDRVIAIEPEKTVTGLKNVSMGEPYFQGHFPGEPVMPGVLILEGMAQTGGILAYLSNREETKEKLVYFAGLEKVRFRKIVRPGDQLIFEIEMLKYKPRLTKMAAHAFVNDELVAEALMMASFA